MKGEDVKTGDVVMKAGRLIRPQHVAVLASVGCIEPPVACRPRVGVISTGSELVDPAEQPEPSQIRDSNSSQLVAQVVRSGALASNLGSAGDTEEAIGRAIEQAKSENDVVLLTGGVSMGDFDLVPDILQKRGFDVLFAKVAVKPGKPTLFARSGDVVCYGLPGNPVSSYVMFELFVRPLLYRMMGHEWVPETSCATLAETYRRRKTERLSWVPVILSEGAAVPVEYHGPAHSSSLVGADGLIPVPVGVNELAKGTPVTVRLI
jgi:molybdopterin molybdotransferase